MNKGNGQPVKQPFPPASEAGRFLSFFEAVQDVFELTGASPGKIIDHYFRIAGHLIRMRFASPGLVSVLTPALEHLAAPPEAGAALTVRLFESAASGVRLPAPPWTWDRIIARGDIRSRDEDRIRVAFQLDAGILSMFDSRSCRAIYWIDDSRRIPFHEAATPLRTILHWFMARHGMQLIHGAAVGGAEGGVLIAGRGGSGKSTVALACLLHGMGYAGDDCVLIGRGPVPGVRSLYGTAMLEPDQMARFPRLRRTIGDPSRPDNKKVMMFLRQDFPRQLIAGFPLRAILMPRVTGLYQTDLKEASPAEVFTALAPSTIAVIPGAGERDFHHIGAFIRQVPNFILEAGTDMAGIGRTVARFLNGK